MSRLLPYHRYTQWNFSRLPRMLSIRDRTVIGAEPTPPTPPLGGAALGDLQALGVVAGLSAAVPLG